MFGHRFFGKAYFSPHYFGPADQSAAGVQVLNYGVMRRRREEYEARQREDESLAQIAHEIAARIDEGLPEPLRPAPAVDEPEPEQFAAPSHDAITARIAAEIEARLRGELDAVPAEVVAVTDDYDDDDEAILALLLAPLVPIANDDDEEAILALLLAA